MACGHCSYITLLLQLKYKLHAIL